MRKMEWAGRSNHIGGIPRGMVFVAVGAFAKAVASLFNSTSVQNADTLIHLVRSRPPGVPLITVSNHMSTSVTFLDSILFFCPCLFLCIIFLVLIHFGYLIDILSAMHEVK